jgi:geranylgeranyl diphosphate synthase type I
MPEPEKNLKQFIGYVKSEVDIRLEQVFDAKIARAGELDSEYKKLIIETKKQVLRGGKRLRPALAVLGYKIAGGKKIESMLDAAVALEIFHNYLLIHDDFMDRDDRRHGGLNITGVYKKRLKNKVPLADLQHAADSQAILAGDICSGLSYEVITQANFDSERKLAAVDRLNQAVFEVAAGQQLDIIASFSKKVSMRHILKINYYKTAGYSVIMPLQFGAILAGNGTKLHPMMEQYGEGVGIGYQLVDDVIGMFGSERVIGKPVISDLREGKQTLLYFYGIALSNANQKAVLQKAFRNPQADNAMLKNVRKVLEDNGAKAKTLVLAKTKSDEAVAITPKLTESSDLQQLLTAFANYCVDRKY